MTLSKPRPISPQTVPAWVLWTPLALAIALVGTARSDDDKPHTQKMNIPYFVYRDVNRNGEYDLADRPYAGQVVFLEQLTGSRVERRSNVAGFVNFGMSLNNDTHDISAPGQYRIVAEPASGWTVTSGASQALSIKGLEGSPSGLIIENTLLSVGVAPKLTITGNLQVPADNDVSSYAVVASSGGEKRRQAAVSSQGAFEIPVEIGTWQLDFKGSDLPVTTQAVELSGYPVVVATVRAAERYPRPNKDKTTIGFDDLTGSDTLYKVPNGYAGLNWHNWIATHHKFYNGHGYVNGTVSGEYLAYNSSGHPASFSAATPFDFLSVYVSVAWPKAEAGFVEIKGWRDNEIVYRDRLKATTSGPIRFEAGYTDVTRVEFSTQHHWQVLLDDLAISIPGWNP